MSREFRALATAIRTPIEEELRTRNLLPAVRRTRLKTLQHNVWRLLQMTNALFDMVQRYRESQSGEGYADRSADTAVIPRIRDDEYPEPSPPPPLDVCGATSTDTNTADLERTVRELEAFNEAVSHDLQLPLRGINGLAHVLLSDHGHALGRDGQELLAQVQENTRRMSAILDGLLELSKVTRGEPHAEPVDLGAIARRVIADLRLAEPSRTVDVRIGEGLFALADPRLVTLVLQNLFANAWKFTGTRAQARIDFERDHGFAFALTDNGVGFDMSRSDLLFQPLRRLPGAEDFPGTGLGLAIARRAVERHGGRLWAHGVLDRGATFYFTLGDPADPEDPA